MQFTGNEENKSIISKVKLCDRILNQPANEMFLQEINVMEPRY